MPSLRDRSNEDWIRAIREQGSGSGDAMQELHDYLRRALAKVLRRQNISEDDLTDFTQETLLQLVKSIHRFRGDSAFTTWATAVATRVAFTELRRRRARENHQEEWESLFGGAEEPAVSNRELPESDLSRNQLLEALNRAIQSKLTDRQRAVVVAELRGIPTIQIAEKLGTNQNALYKMHHDARKKLRMALVAEGYTPELLHEFAEEASKS